MSACLFNGDQDKSRSRSLSSSQRVVWLPEEPQTESIEGVASGEWNEIDDGVHEWETSVFHFMPCHTFYFLICICPSLIQCYQ